MHITAETPSEHFDTHDYAEAAIELIHYTLHEELYWLTKLAAEVLNTEAPDDDQAQDLKAWNDSLADMRSEIAKRTSRGAVNVTVHGVTTEADLIRFLSALATLEVLARRKAA